MWGGRETGGREGGRVCVYVRETERKRESTCASMKANYSFGSLEEGLDEGAKNSDLLLIVTFFWSFRFS